MDLSGTVFRESPDWNYDHLSLCHVSIVLEDACLSMRAQFAAFGPQGQLLLEQILGAVKLGLMQSLNTVFLVSLGILLVGLFVVVFLPEIELQPAQPDTKE